MDITFKTSNGKFNMRSVGVIIHENRLLVYQNEGYPYKCLPGGRVQFGETAEATVIREIKEEIGIDAKVVRPLWINQAFFTEDVEQIQFHEICFYFLIQLPATFKHFSNKEFETHEKNKTHYFEWVDLSNIKDINIYPSFLKNEINNLQCDLQLRTEIQ